MRRITLGQLLVGTNRGKLITVLNHKRNMIF